MRVIYHHRYYWSPPVGMAIPRTFVAYRREDGSIGNVVLEGHPEPGPDMDIAVEARILELD